VGEAGETDVCLSLTCVDERRPVANLQGRLGSSATSMEIYD